MEVNSLVKVGTQMIVKGGVTDTVFELRGILSRIEEAQLVESSISEELSSIQRQLHDIEGATEGFYGEMVEESLVRARKLLSYQHRTKELLDRLAAFMRVQDRDAGYWD